MKIEVKTMKLQGERRDGRIVDIEETIIPAPADTFALLEQDCGDADPCRYTITRVLAFHATLMRYEHHMPDDTPPTAETVKFITTDSEIVPILNEKCGVKNPCYYATFENIKMYGACLLHVGSLSECEAKRLEMIKQG